MIDTLKARRSGASVVVLGVPLDHNSSFIRGPRKAPAAIRRALLEGATNMTSESGVDLGLDDRWCDWGDVDCQGEAADMLRIEQAAAEAWTSARLLALGGNRDSHASPIHR